MEREYEINLMWSRAEHKGMKAVHNTTGNVVEITYTCPDTGDTENVWFDTFVFEKLGHIFKMIENKY